MLYVIMHIRIINKSNRIILNVFRGIKSEKIDSFNCYKVVSL